MNNSIFKLGFLFTFMFVAPNFLYAQNFQPDSESELINEVDVIAPFPGVNDDNSLVPADVAQPTNTGIDTSILNEKRPTIPNVVPYSGRTDSTNLSAFDQIAPANSFGGQPLSNLLNQIFYIGLGIAVVLALIMIVRGGIQYMTIDAATSKDSGKKMVQAALGGLTLAFAGILILNTINPNLTTLNLTFQSLKLGQFGGNDAPITSGQRDPVTGEPIGGPISSKFTDPELEAYTLAKIKELGFSNLSPADKAAFFPNGGTDEEWLALVSAMIKNESGFNPNTTYTENFKDRNGNYVVSTGLFQLSSESVSGYGFNLTTEQLKDPKTNIDVGLHILKNWVQKDGVISGQDNTGGARYWSVLRPTGKLETVRNDMKQ